MEHYYTENPDCPEKEDQFHVQIVNKDFVFHTNTAVFSKKSLDFGTRVLIESICAKNTDMTGDLLDMGCGYGPISVALGTIYPNLSITMADINNRALSLAKKNAKENRVSNIRKILSSDSFNQIKDMYQYVVTNPPIRAGKKVVFSIYEGAYEHLKAGGELYVVLQKKQGAPSSQQKLTELFGNCTVIQKKSGYYILCSQK